MRKRKPIPVSAWAEKHRKLTTSVISGPWRNSNTPYLAGIMDAIPFSSIQNITICKSPQVGGTEAGHNFIGYALDRSPGPVMYVFPDRDTAKDNSKDRIIPMIESSPRLRSYLTGSDDDKSQMRIKLKHCIIYMAWAHSPSSLANKPCRYVIFDETDKYPLNLPGEADPISLGEKRTNTYKRSGKARVIKLSTPTTETGYIWKAYSSAQFRYHFWVSCPKCKAYQKMDFDHILFDKENFTPDMILSKKLARYKCDKCGAMWDDHDRDDAVRSGMWREEMSEMSLSEHLNREKPMDIAFHIPAWISPFISLSEIACAFLKGLNDKNLLKDFMNNYKAEPWRTYTHERAEEKILALKDDRPRGIVPSGGKISALTAAADTQKNGFWYEIRAWGFGHETESWQIREGFVETFDALEQVLFKDVYRDKDGIEYPVQLAVIDAMGDKTSQVYDFCRKFRGRLIPYKGEQRLASPVKFSNIEYYPGTQRAIPGGLKLVRADTQYFKNLLASKLEIMPGDPGQWHFHAETTMDWAIQMCSEYVNDKNLWDVIPGKPNHGWDCSHMNILAAEILQLKFRRHTVIIPAGRPREREKREDGENPYTEGRRIFG